MKKRVIATLIDWLILGVGMFFAAKYLPEWIWVVKLGTPPFTVTIPSVGGLVAVLYLAGRDLLFRNAGIGKRIMGLRVVTEEGKAPRVGRMLLHGLLLSFVGWILLWVKKREFQAWELKYLKVTVKERGALKQGKESED